MPYAGPAGWLAIAIETFFRVLRLGVIVWQPLMFRAMNEQDRTDTLMTNIRIYGYTDEEAIGILLLPSLALSQEYLRTSC